MGLFSSVVSGAIGYGISEASKSHPVRDFLDKNFGDNRRDLEDVIKDFARSRNIFCYDDNFARELHRIARNYETNRYKD